MNKAYETYVIKENDSLQIIATKYGCNWEDIANLNNLSYPFISSEVIPGETNIAYVGSTILIPIEKVYKKNSSIATIEKRVYGSDLQFLRYEDHSLEPYLLDTSEGDIQISEGINNLYQACCSRFTVDKGSLVLHPEYGTEIRQFLGKGKGNYKTLIKIKLDVKRTLLQDPRIERVEEVVVKFKDGVCRISAEVVPHKPLGSFTFDYSI